MKKALFLLLCLMPLFAAAQENGWTIVARDTARYAPAAMANGELGLVVGKEPFAVGPLIVGSACERGDRNRVSRILEGICPLGLSMPSAGPIGSWEQRSTCGGPSIRPVSRRMPPPSSVAFGLCATCPMP